MPRLPITLPQQHKRAIFFCRLNYIEVRGGLGRGEQLLDDFFVTNNQSIISKLIDPRWEFDMGSLEYKDFIKSPMAAYAYIENCVPGTELAVLERYLMTLDQFEQIIWLDGDNCVGHELAFIINEPTISSNLYGGLRVRADFTKEKIVIPADRFRELVRFYRALFKENDATPALMHTKGNSTRFTRALGLISRSQRTTLLAEKITFFCSALEALLSTSQAELSHQIAERVAVLTSQKAEVRLANYKFIKACYTFRSKYIHGSPIKQTDEGIIIEMCKKLDHAVRLTVESVFEDGALLKILDDEEELDNYMLRKIFRSDV